MEKSKIKNIFKNFEFWFVILIFAFCILDFSGCATVIEAGKGFVGISTKALEDNRKNALAKTFNCDYNTCYGETEKILKNIGAYIYARDTKKKMIAIYVSEQDTTPVGLFFKEIDANNTQIEVSSLSTYAKEFISGKVFSVLEKSLSHKEEETEKTDAKEAVGDK